MPVRVVLVVAEEVRCHHWLIGHGGDKADARDSSVHGCPMHGTV